MVAEEAIESVGLFLKHYKSEPAQEIKIEEESKDVKVVNQFVSHANLSSTSTHYDSVCERGEQVHLPTQDAFRMLVGVFRLGQANLDFSIRASGLENKLKMSMEDLSLL